MRSPALGQEGQGCLSPSFKYNPLLVLMKTMLPHRPLQTLSPRKEGGRRWLDGLGSRSLLTVAAPAGSGPGLRPPGDRHPGAGGGRGGRGKPGASGPPGGSLGWSGRPWRRGEWWVCAERARRSLTLDTIFLSWLSDPAMAAAS